MRFVFGSRGAAQAAILLLALCLCTPALASHGDAKAMKKGILLVAFGTSVPEAQGSFKSMESLVHKAYPEIPVRWAFTSNIIREKLIKEEGRVTDSVQTALARMMDDGFTHVVVQSLHSIPGEEFNRKVLGVADAFADVPGGFERLEVGRPLMTTPHDMELMVDAILATVPKARKKGDVVVLMGHGTHHPGNVYYPALQWYLSRKDADILVGTVEGTPGLDDVLAGLKARKAGKVWLMPLMSVAGDHARNDMAGAEEDSWKSVLTKEGYAIESVLKGTAEYEAFGNLWVSHIKEPMAQLAD